MSAIQEVEQQFAIPVVSIVDIGDILAYLKTQQDSAALITSIEEYRQKYGV